MTEESPAVWMESTYENVFVRCPYCEGTSIYNRVSDLHSPEAISNATVTCERCGESFTIIGDSVNEAYEMLLFDVYDLLRQKRYMSAVSNISQAYEVFFALFLRAHFAYRPFVRDITQGMPALNNVHELLFEKTRERSFRPMRAIFLHRVVEDVPANLSISVEILGNLADLIAEPKASITTRHPDPVVRSLLGRIKSVRVNELRNMSVHHRAYRPRRDEAEAALEEAREILFPLGRLLDLRNDLNWYMEKYRERGER